MFDFGSIFASLFASVSSGRKNAMTTSAGKEAPAMRLRVGLKVVASRARFRLGISLAVGLIWTGAALGKGPLFPRAVYPAGDAPASVSIADLDGDQVPDMAVANEGSDNVSILLGFGDGTFSSPVHYAVGDGPISLAIGDLNGDRVFDLVVVNTSSDNVSVLIGSGDGTFVAVADLVLTAYYHPSNWINEKTPKEARGGTSEAAAVGTEPSAAPGR